MPRFALAGLLRLVVCFSAASPALAQVSEFRLGEGGQWTETARAEPGSEAAPLVEARRLLAEGKAEAARRLLTPWIEERKRTDHPLLAEAYLLSGDAWVAIGNEYKALYDYEALIRQFPGSPEFVTALEREMEIGLRYMGGLKRKQWGVRWVGAKGDGAELLIRIQERLPGSRLAERAAIELADYYYRADELELAAEAYEIVLKNFPRSQYRAEAMVRLVYTQIARYEGPRYDGAGLVEAREMVEDFRAAYPADAERAGLNRDLINRLDGQMAAQLLDKARFYERRNDPVAARSILRRVVSRHPGTGAARSALATMQERGWITVPAPGAATGGAPGPAAARPTEPAASERRP